MQTYDEMVDTELAYVGKIPRSWQLTPASMLFTENKQNNQSLISQVPLQFKMGDIIRKKVDIDDKLLEEIRRYTVVEKGDIMVNGLNLNYDFATQRVALVGEDGCITPAYISLRTRENYSPKYATYLLKALDGQKVLNGWGTGIRLTLNYIEFKKYRLPKPDIKIQQKIADFLDQETAQIDNLIAKQERLLELLEEKRRATITHAVTRGLNPNVELKETNIPWLGQIPVHWSTSRVKDIANITLGKMVQNEQKKADEVYKPYLKSRNIQWGGINLSNVDEMWFKPGELREYSLKDNDIVVSEGGDVGKCVMWQESYGEMYFQNSVNRVRVKGSTEAKYIYYVFQHLALNQVFMNTVNKVSIAHLTKDKLNTYSVPTPDKAEQQSIAIFLDEEDKKFSAMKRKIQTQITLLRERRTSLISHAVTGKIKV